MGEYNPEEWGNIALKKATIERIEQRKIHPKQSYQEVIEEILNETADQEYQRSDRLVPKK